MTIIRSIFSTIAVFFLFFFSLILIPVKTFIETGHFISSLLAIETQWPIFLTTILILLPVLLFLLVMDRIFPKVKIKKDKWTVTCLIFLFLFLLIIPIDLIKTNFDHNARVFIYNSKKITYLPEKNIYFLKYHHEKIIQIDKNFNHKLINKNWNLIYKFHISILDEELPNLLNSLTQVLKSYFMKERWFYDPSQPWKNKIDKIIQKRLGKIPSSHFISKTELENILQKQLEDYFKNNLNVKCEIKFTIIDAKKITEL